MAVTHKTPKSASGQGTPKPSQTCYVFKSASEMPVIKRDYVVQSPTPLGQRPADQSEKRK